MSEGIQFSWEYFEKFDCDFEVPHKNPVFSTHSFKNRFNYDEFLNHIFSKRIEGYVILQGLSIKKTSRSQFHGFLPIKANLSQNNWSSFTKNLYPNLKPVKNVVVGVHSTTELGMKNGYYSGGGGKNFYIFFYYTIRQIWVALF
jgi:hypothetical protein